MKISSSLMYLLLYAATKKYKKKAERKEIKNTRYLFSLFDNL